MTTISATSVPTADTRRPLPVTLALLVGGMLGILFAIEAEWYPGAAIATLALIALAFSLWMMHRTVGVLAVHRLTIPGVWYWTYLATIFFPAALVYLNHPGWIVVPSADLETESIGNIRLCAERGAWVFFDVADWRRFMWARPMKLDSLEVLPTDLRAVLGLLKPPQPQPQVARRPDTVCAEIGGAR